MKSLRRLDAPPELAEAAGLASVLTSVQTAARRVARWQNAGAAYACCDAARVAG